MMGHVDGFLAALRNYDKENIQPEVVRAIQPYLQDKGRQKLVIYIFVLHKSYLLCTYRYYRQIDHFFPSTSGILFKLEYVVVLVKLGGV